MLSLLPTQYTFLMLVYRGRDHNNLDKTKEISECPFDYIEEDTL